MKTERSGSFECKCEDNRLLKLIREEMAPPPPAEDGPAQDAERDGEGVVVANGNGHAREELDESLDAEVRELRELIEHGGGEGLEEEVDDENDDDDVYDEDVNAAERIVEEFGGFDPPLYIQRLDSEIELYSAFRAFLLFYSYRIFSRIWPFGRCLISSSVAGVSP